MLRTSSSRVRFDTDGNGGEELRQAIRLEVDEISDIGIAGMGAESDVAIKPGYRPLRNRAAGTAGAGASINH
jgi:hypothetical protein